MSSLFKTYLLVWMFILVGFVLICFNILSVSTVLNAIKLVLVYAMYVLFKTFKSICRGGVHLCES